MDKISDALIRNLGGSTAVAKALGVAQNRVANWQVRGVAWEFRHAVAELAREQNVEVPPEFLKPSVAA